MQRIPWEEVYAKYVNYIKYAASRTFLKFQSNAFKVNSPEDLFQEGQLVMYKCWIAYGDKPADELAKLIKAAVWRRMQELAGKKQFFTTDFDTLQQQGQEPGYEKDFALSLESEESLQKVAELLKDEPIALTILKEFVNPSQRTIWEAKMDVERKQQLRDQNYIVVVPTSVQPTKRAIQRAMEISKLSFDTNFKILKNALAQVFFTPEKRERMSTGI